MHWCHVSRLPAPPMDIFNCCLTTEPRNQYLYLLIYLSTHWGGVLSVGALSSCYWGRYFVIKRFKAQLQVRSEHNRVQAGLKIWLKLPRARCTIIITLLSTHRCSVARTVGPSFSGNRATGAGVAAVTGPLPRVTLPLVPTSGQLRAGCWWGRAGRGRGPCQGRRGGRGWWAWAGDHVELDTLCLDLIYNLNV